MKDQCELVVETLALWSCKLDGSLRPDSDFAPYLLWNSSSAPRRSFGTLKCHRKCGTVIFLYHYSYSSSILISIRFNPRFLVLLLVAGGNSAVRRRVSSSSGSDPLRTSYSCRFSPTSTNVTVCKTNKVAISEGSGTRDVVCMFRCWLSTNCRMARDLLCNSLPLLMIRNRDAKPLN